MSAGKNRTPLWKTLKELFAEGGLPSVFVEGLGWSHGNLPVSQVSVGDDIFSLAPISELKNYWIIEISGDDIPTPKEQSAIDRKVAELYPERILVFSDGNAHHWRWPRETPSGGVSFETLTVGASSLPSFLAQRLVGLAFDIADFRAGITLVDVRNRVRGKFDAAKVTKRFFDAFKVQRTKLAESIVGLDSEEQQSSYSTLLLNRLMLLYFLQKREFLNGDPNYLENCLAGVKGLEGEQQFFGFYRDVLLPMFFERLASHRQTQLEPKIEKLLGDIPYINGGIYEPSELEQTHGDSLNVPDQAFEKIFAFFGAFNWHLDTRPSGLENEINPEVIGYIFEQYINLTTGGKKDKGAYYTPEDVTGYMVGVALIPRIIDDLGELDIPIFDLLQSDPVRYIHPAMLHGFDLAEDRWLAAPENLSACWDDDPIHWEALDDAEHDPEFCLPGEKWVEMFYRRQRIETLVPRLKNGLVSETNELITYNLNSRLLLTDAIDRIGSSDVAMALWERLTSISVLDPTCGSGAFLFAAMEALEDAYHHLLSVIESVPGDFGTVSLTESMQGHPNARYFVRKSIALNNLHGTDLMPDAIETAKLRIFLALVSCLEAREELEPLPDLDFNLKCGNLLVGLRDPSELSRFGGDLVGQLILDELSPKIESYQNDYLVFVETSKAGLTQELEEVRTRLDESISELRNSVASVFTPTGISPETDLQTWLKRYRPLHWFVEFPQIMSRGGFDVVIGNPPYVGHRNLDPEEKRQLEPYQTSACPDLYAPCYERSLELLSERGRHAFVVMLNLVFSERFAKLREILGSRGGAEWWSTYGSFAGGLFAGIEVRNCIVVLAPGKDQFSSHHQAFGVENRRNVFGQIEYHESPRDESTPPLRGGVLTELARFLDTLELRTIAGDSQYSGSELYLRPTAGYWVPVLPTSAPVFNERFEITTERDSALIRLQLYNAEDWAVSLVSIGSKIGYFWWLVKGDNFHVNADETDGPRALGIIASRQQAELRSLASSVVSYLPKAVVFISHKGIRPNIRWSDLKTLTAEFEKKLLEVAGHPDLWRPLNIWYRQSMRSGGASPKDRQPPDDLRDVFSLARGW